jgi:6-phospho-3-hexuloisomerase
MRWLETAKEILKEIKLALESLDQTQVEGILERLILIRDEGKKMLIVGAGRSGLVGKAFAMRLMHLGFDVYVIGETITPSIGSGDLVLVISGSGSGALSITSAGLAKRLGSIVVAVTSYPDSELGQIADYTVEIPGREVIAREQEYQARQLLGEHESLTPMGTLFEDSCVIFFDTIVTELMIRLGVTEKSMRRKHSTIE